MSKYKCNNDNDDDSDNSSNWHLLDICRVLDAILSASHICYLPLFSEKPSEVRLLLHPNEEIILFS